MKPTQNILKDIINSFREVLLRSQIDLEYYNRVKELSPNIAADFASEIARIEAYQRQALEKLKITKEMLEKEIKLQAKKEKKNIS